MNQRMKSLRLANEIRLGGVRQRRALVGQPAATVIPALIEPTEELAALRLSHVFDAQGRQGPIPKIGAVRLNWAFRELSRKYPGGRRWHGRLRLRNLSKTERRRLVRELYELAPRWWREAGANVERQAA